jgi:Replication protein
VPTAAPKAQGRRPARSAKREAPLGNYANRSSPAGQGDLSGALLEAQLLQEELDLAESRRARRRQRARFRDKLRAITTLDRVRQCGATTLTGTGGPVLRLAGEGASRVAGYAGLVTCGSVWACPVCAAKIAAKRAEELARVIRKVLESGGSASLVTLTMRHHSGHRLKDLWKALSYAWSRVTSGKHWMADQVLGGMLGWVRVVEATYGQHGWHLHIHALVCWRSKVSLELAETIGGRMWERWAKALKRRGFESWQNHGGLDVRMASLRNDNLSEYFVKLAREITSSATKDSKAGRSPFALLRDGLATGLADDLDLWFEWERVSKGRRQITWSLGEHDLRKFAELGKEQTDEEVAAEEELQGEDVMALTGETWDGLVRSGTTCDLLDVAEVEGYEGAAAYLTARGFEWLAVTI